MKLILFVLRLANNKKSIDGVSWCTNVICGQLLVIPCVGTLREDLFRLMHDSLRHFGFDKLYASLRDASLLAKHVKGLARSLHTRCTKCNE